MKPFMDEDFLLEGDSAKRLYHDYAKDMPIIDYHCHVSPDEILKDACLDNLGYAWLGGDHYKWRLMRACGVPEEKITGNASWEEKFLAYAACVAKAVGNPLYHWTHLELKRFFGYDGPLNERTAPEVWALGKRILAQEDMHVRGLILRSKVYAIGTTDDPADSLMSHGALALDKGFSVRVVPSYRPDKAVNIDKPGFAEYLSRLCGGPVSLAELKQALLQALDRFQALGCRASDHGLDTIPYAPCTEGYAETVLQKACKGEAITPLEAEGYKTHLLLFLGEALHERDMVMQLHFGAQRNLNPPMFRALGPDTGFDSIGDTGCAAKLAGLLGALESRGALPRTIVYSLNPVDNAMIDSVIGSFQGGSLCKLQHGSAWWFNDTLHGMREQLTTLASIGLLSGFVGMLTDSRSFLSYTRHEYFRRILCGLIGGWVDRGEVYPDFDLLGKMVQDISFNNAKAYFKL